MPRWLNRRKWIFDDLIDPSLWKDYDTYMKEADEQREKDIQKSIINCEGRSRNL
jgi:hypothetical protein